MPAQPQFGREMHSRVPPRVQQIMAKKLERSVPGYMKQYIGPYMQQNVVHPMAGGSMPMSGPTVSPSAPTLHANTGESWRQSHFQPTNSPQPPAETAPTASVDGQLNQPPADPYTFITEPAVAKKSFSLPGAGSMVTRVAVVAGGLLVLVIIFSIAKSLLSSTPSLAAFVPVVQDQQELIHLVTGASQQKGLSDSTQKFLATAQLSLPSNQADILSYLAKNHYKFPAKRLTAKLSATTDSQLTTAATNSTYDQVFQSTMTTQLNNYLNDLAAAYKQTTGKNGHVLLNSDFNQTKLLLIQLQPGS